MNPPASRTDSTGHPDRAWTGLVLAAGASSRMGRPKQSLQWNGTTLVDHTIQTVRTAGASEVLVVEQSSTPRPGAISVANPRWADGMGRSLEVGLRAALDGKLCPAREVCLVHLCDLPRVRPRSLASLVAAVSAENPVAVAEFDQTFGPPVALHAGVIAAVIEMLVADASRGGKAVLRSLGVRLTRVPIEEAAHDLDTPADYANATQRLAVDDDHLP